MAFGEVYVQDAECLATIDLLMATCPEFCALGINDALEEAKGMAEEEVPVDTGDAKSKIDIIPATPTPAFVAQLRSMAQYSTAIENPDGKYYSRDPGSTPPPWRALLGWASRHNPGDVSDASFAYRVAQSVGKRGVASRPYIAYLAEEKLPALLEIHMMIALEAWQME